MAASPRRHLCVCRLFLKTLSFCSGLPTVSTVPPLASACPSGRTGTDFGHLRLISIVLRLDCVKLPSHLHNLSPKNTFRNNPILLETPDVRADILFGSHQRLRGGPALSPAVASSRSMTLRAVFRKVIACRPVPFQSSAVAYDETVRFPTCKYSIGYLYDFFLSFCQISLLDSSDCCCLDGPQLASFLCHLFARGGVPELVDFSKWYFPALFSLKNRQVIPSFRGRSSRSLVARALPGGCSLFSIRAQLSSSDPLLARWQDSLLYCKGAFPSVTLEMCDASLEKAYARFGVPSVPLSDVVARLVSEEALPLLSEILAWPWRRFHNASNRRSYELEVEALRFQVALIEDEIACFTRQSGYESRSLRLKLERLLARCHLQILESRRRYKEYRFESILERHGPLYFLEEYGPGNPFSACPVGASFGGALGSSRRKGGQHAALTRVYFPSAEGELFLSGWSTVFSRDVAYEKYVLGFASFSSDELDARILAEVVPSWNDPHTKQWSYPLLTQPLSSQTATVRAIMTVALDSPLRASLFAIAEPLKIRVIGRSQPEHYYAASLMQPWLWSAVSSHPSFVLTSRPVDESCLSRVMSLDDRAPMYLSGDYAGATNDLSNHVTGPIVDALCRLAGVPTDFQAIMRKCLFDHVLVEEGTDRCVFQARGQFMGSPVSFPVLCVANALLVRCASRMCPLDERLPRLLARSPVLINGDDLLVRCWPSLHAWWEELGPSFGLASSVGKTYFASDFCTLNSVIFRLRGSTLAAVPVIRWNLLRPYPPTTKTRDVIGDGRPLSGIGDQCQVFCDSHKGLLRPDGSPMSLDAAKMFWRFQSSIVRRIWSSGEVTHPCLPTRMCGLGVPFSFFRCLKISTPSLRDLRAGVWMRDHFNPPTSTACVLPRRPAGSRIAVRRSVRSLPSLGISSAYVNFFCAETLERPSSFSKHSRQHLCRQAYVQESSVRVSSDHMSHLDDFISEVCSDYVCFEEHRLDFLQRPETLLCA